MQATCYIYCYVHLGKGPVSQSIVSLTSSLRGELIKCFTTLKPNTQIFLLKKREKLLQNAKASHIFSTKIIDIFQILLH